MYSGNGASTIPEHRNDRGESKGRGENVFRLNVRHENPAPSCPPWKSTQFWKKHDQNGSWWKKLEHFEIDHQNSILPQNLQKSPATEKHTMIFLPCRNVLRPTLPEYIQLIICQPNSRGLRHNQCHAHTAFSADHLASLRLIWRFCIIQWRRYKSSSLSHGKLPRGHYKSGICRSWGVPSM